MDEHRQLTNSSFFKLMLKKGTLRDLWILNRLCQQQKTLKNYTIECVIYVEKYYIVHYHLATLKSELS